MTTTAHDLRHEVPWIPVVYLDGRTVTLPLQPLLEDAHQVRELRTEPHIWAGLMRFLPGVVALIARQEPTADYDAWAHDGLPKDAIARALDSVGDRWHLRHPETPFLQDVRIVEDEKNANRTEWLLLGPGGSSKAWWGKDGDAGHPDAGTVARIAQGLVVSWFFSAGSPGRAVGFYTDQPDSGWRPRGTLGFHNHGLRVFWKGRSLAETLLANTMENHVAVSGRHGDNLPLWAVDGDSRPGAGALTASTWTGSAYRLLWDDTGACIGVNGAGRRIKGLPVDAAEAKDAVKAVEQDVWRADPTIPRVPLLKAGEETGEVRPVRPLHPSATAMQWAAEWFAIDDRRNAARPMEPGLVETSGVDVFTIRMEGARQAPEIAHLARVGEVSAIASPRARTRLITLANDILTPYRKYFYGAAVKALGKDTAPALTEKLFAQFSVEAEPLLDELVHADTLDDGVEPRFAGAAIAAFQKVIAPFANSTTLAGGPTFDGIASALAYLTARVHGSTPPHQPGEGTAALVHWAIAVRQSPRGAATRAALSRATTPAACEAALQVPSVAKRVAHLPPHQRAAAVGALGYIVRGSRLNHTPDIPLGRSLADQDGSGQGEVLAAALAAPQPVALRLLGNAVSRCAAAGPVNLHEFVDLLTQWDDLDVKTRSKYLVEFHTANRA